MLIPDTLGLLLYIDLVQSEKNWRAKELKTLGELQRASESWLGYWQIMPVFIMVLRVDYNIYHNIVRLLSTRA